MTEMRPVLNAEITSTELLRWYWLHDELSRFARTLGISRAGGKLELTGRIVASLNGRVHADSPPPRRPPAAPLPDELTPATVLPGGQRCTQQLRHYLVAAIGPQFRFDQAMRDFLGSDESCTLGSVVEHWYETRSRGPADIGPQFELNHFLREWHRQHPGSHRAEALDAWRAHRAQPVEARTGVSVSRPAAVSHGAH